MRFPWLQVDSDFIASKAAELGALLGVSRREAAGLALDLWSWVLSRSPPDRPPDGILTGSAPVPVLASAVSWPDPERLASALEEVGLLERIPGGLRIKGLERYKATWEKNRRRPKRDRTGTDPESPPEPTRKTYTHTYTQKEETTFPASQGAAVAPALEDLPGATQHAETVGEAPGRPPLTLAFAKPDATPPAKKPKPPKPAESRGDPRHAPLVDALVKADAEVHGRPYGFRGGRDAKAVSDCLALADQDGTTAGEAAPAEVLRRWRIGRRWQGFPACNSLQDLAAKWNAYVREQGPPTRQVASVTKGAVRAELFDHSHVGPVENF